MKIRQFRRFNRDDYRAAPDWFLNFLDNLNLMVDQLNVLLQNNIDIDNNLLAERRTLSVTHNTPINVTMQKLTQQPYLVRAGYASGHVVTGCNITGYNSDGSVAVTVTFADAPTSPVSTTLIFEP